MNSTEPEPRLRRIPAPVRPALECFKSMAEERCPGLIRAFYVVGSVALGGYTERFSDIDFVAVLSRKTCQGDIQSLDALHRVLRGKFATLRLSGDYVQWGDLGRLENEISGHPYYHDGKFHSNGHFEINAVTWWILKHHGIAIWGEEPGRLPLNVDWQVLLARMHENLNTYWLSWTRRPHAYLSMCSDQGFQWAVTGVLRQYYTFRENSITTKAEAAAYALKNLPQRWHPLINDAMSIRHGRNSRQYRLRLLRMVDAARFLKYVIRVCNEDLAERNSPG